MSRLSSRLSTRPSPRHAASVVAGLALAAGAVVSAGTAQAAYEDPTMSLPRHTSGTPGLGPHFPYVQVIPIGGVVPLNNQAIINRTKHGYIFRAGQQDSDLTVTLTDGRLDFVDTATQAWKWLPKRCRQVDVHQGVGASCRVPDKFTLAEPMLVEIWPRLGDDVVDTSALPALFDVSMLADAGDDVAYFGAGNDFFNGAQDADRAYGGEGRDWIRTGPADDFLDGGPGADYLVGVEDDDTVYGGDGDDRVYGSTGRDELFAGEGADYVSCGGGVDTATFKPTDRAVHCENKNPS